MVSPGLKAQTDAEYDAAIAAIQEGGVYRIKTVANETPYYVTTAGALTSDKDKAGFFTLTKTTGGALKSVGIRIDSGTDRFTNPPLSNNVANLKPGSFSHSTGDRADWERQVLFLNEDGKFAIRSCNTQPATSSWGDAGRTFWTYAVADVVTPCYTYDAAFVWELDGPLTAVNVSYKLVESDGTQVGNVVSAKQEANSKINVPASFTSSFLYNYDIDGTIGEEDCTITITRIMKKGTVHSLTDLSNAKTYNIGCERGVFLTKNNYLASTGHGSLKAADPTEFAVISYEDNYYLYSVADKMFVTNTGALSEMPVKGVNDAVVMTPKADPLFLYTFKINETTQYGLNTNGNDPYGYVINSWVTADAGNQYFMIEVADFDATEALAALNDFFHPSYFVTYVVKDEAGNELFKSEAVPTRKGAKITTLPAEYQLPFTQYSEADATIEETETTVEFTATWAGPFQVSTSEADAKWYNMTIRSDYSVFVSDEEPYYPKKANNMQKLSDAYQWAFAGNAYTGIMVFNKAKGIKYTLTKDGDAAVMREGQYLWTIGKNGDGFTLKEPKTDYNCINQSGGASGPLKFWNSANAPGDNGSTFRISAVPTSFDFTIGEAGYATLYLPYSVTAVAPEAAEVTGVPEAKGVWTFDNPDNLLAGTGVATMEAAKHEKGKVEVTTPAEANIVAVAGPAKGKGAISIPVGSSLKMTTNVDATELKTYSFMMDIKLADVENYTSLYQSNVNNNNDGELFVNKGKIGVNYNGVGYNGTVVADTWHRIVFVAEDALPTIYLDGVQVGKANKADLRWAMDPTTLFFADEDGEETEVVTAAIRFWDVALTADQVAAIGTVKVADEDEDEGVMAYTGVVNGEYLTTTKIGSVVPANTAVVLKAEPGTYTFAVDNSMLNVAQACVLTNALGDNKLSEADFSVIGYITNTDGKISKNQQTFWMADEEDGGKVFEAYWANIPDPTTPLAVGQRVIITGKLQKYVSNKGAVTCEIKNASVIVVENDLKGTFTEIDAKGKYVLAKPEGENVGFYMAKSGKLAANKAFLELREATEIKAFYFDAPESETAIETIEAKNGAETVQGIYNLSGQRVSKAQKGIYIVNGKKVLF